MIKQCKEGAASYSSTCYFMKIARESLQSVQKKLTRGSLSVVENAIYDARERLSSDATRSFAVKFPRYAETVVRA